MHTNCKCRLCQLKASGLHPEVAEAKFAKEQNELMDKYGWIAHYVADDSDYPLGANFHTHGMAENFGHLDLQVVFPVDPQIVHSLFWNVFNRIKEGEQFKDGDTAERIAGGGYLVKFVDAIENGRPVLRIILPDKDGNLDRDTLTGSMAQQYDDI